MTKHKRIGQAPVIETVEVDKTDHLEGHTHAILPKSAKWYAFWGNKCPVCKAPANIILEPVK